MSLAVAVPEAPRGSYREMWLITLGHSLTHWYPATFYLLLPIIGKELGLSYSQIGLIMTCQYIAGAVANIPGGVLVDTVGRALDRKSTRLNSSHSQISYAVFCLKKKKNDDADLTVQRENHTPS